MRLYNLCFGAVLCFLLLSGGYVTAETKTDATMSEATATHHHHHEHAVPGHGPSVTLDTLPSDLQARVPATLQFTIVDENGKPPGNFSLSHERILHTVIIGEDLEVFGHIHPEDFGPVTNEMIAAGRFTVQHTFPKAGEYLVAVDYAVGDDHFSQQFMLFVSGEPSMDDPKQDFSRNRVLGDYRVDLFTAPDPPAAGKEASLTFRIMRGETPVTDLELYLAAPMHLAIVHAELDRFIHAHGDRPGSGGHASHAVGHIHGTMKGEYGPEIEARVIFPVSGVYRIFSQIQHNGKILLVPFMVKVD